MRAAAAAAAMVWLPSFYGNHQTCQPPRGLWPKRHHLASQLTSIAGKAICGWRNRQDTCAACCMLFRWKADEEPHWAASGCCEEAMEDGRWMDEENVNSPLVWGNESGDGHAPTYTAGALLTEICPEWLRECCSIPVASIDCIRFRQDSWGTFWINLRLKVHRGMCNRGVRNEWNVPNAHPN